MSRKKRVLLVDDDVDFVDATQMLLEQEGYEVVTAYSGAAALEVVAKIELDLILMDVMMTSDTEGIEISRRIRELPEARDVPVILMTGIRTALNLPHSLEPDEDWLPVKAVLDKPVPPERLLAELRKHLA